MASKFTKIRIQKDGTLLAVYSNNEGDVFTQEGINRVHQDLAEAMKSLRPFLAILSEQHEYLIEPIDTFSIDEFCAKELPNILVNQISISGDGEREGVVITGQRLLKNGKVMNITTPNMQYTDDTFMYGGELSIIVDGLIEEAKMYVFEGKCENEQLKFDFEDVPDFEDTNKAS